MKALLALALFSSATALAKEHFACNANALSPAERARYHEVTKTLLTTVQEKTELKNGYGFRLPPTSLLSAAEWIALERRCCPFFTFDLEQARDQGPVWLRVTGSDGVKEFIRAEFDL